MTSQLLSTIDTLSISLLLGILGIAITVFTVIYSFMENTKERKRNIGDRVRNNQQSDPVLETDLRFAIDYLYGLRKMNYWVMSIIIADIIVLIIYTAHMVLPTSRIVSFMAYGLLALLLFVCLTVLAIYFAQYLKRYKSI